MMTQPKYDLAVFVGRFQPFHLGHLAAVKEATNVAERVLILIGSSFISTTPKNPWTFNERADMIRTTVDMCPHLKDAVLGPEALVDYPSDTDWYAQVQTVVDRYSDQLPENPRICIVGHNKDESSFYLKGFPQWKFIELQMHALHGSKTMDATRVRDLLFRGETMFLSGALPQPVMDYLMEWNTTETAQRLQEEFRSIDEYKKSWAGSPFPPQFITCDAVVIQSGHVLMIQRKHNPGQGTWAIPGGFVDHKERIRKAVIRELLEETSIDLQPEVLDRTIVAEKYFDDPFRSQRGRTVTFAFLFRLNDAKPLPRVKGGDDAAVARWVPIAEVHAMREQIFEDHYAIILEMLRNA